MSLSHLKFSNHFATLNYIPSRSVVLRVPFYRLEAEKKNKPVFISQNSNLKTKGSTVTLENHNISFRKVMGIIFLKCLLVHFCLLDLIVSGAQPLCHYWLKKGKALSTDGEAAYDVRETMFTKPLFFPLKPSFPAPHAA